jgi:hypothetical protein
MKARDFAATVPKKSQLVALADERRPTHYRFGRTGVIWQSTLPIRELFKDGYRDDPQSIWCARDSVTEDLDASHGHFFVRTAVFSQRELEENQTEVEGRSFQTLAGVVDYVHSNMPDVNIWLILNKNGHPIFRIDSF